MDQSTAVCVIGPGRAGTSLTMRALNLLGVYIGPEEDLVEPGPGGPKGFWERRDMMRLDDKILRAFGGSWRKPPPLPPGWELSERLAPERECARRLLERVFAGRPLWGWKNPRVTLTTAFWLRLVPDLRFVVCLRNPIDVATSLTPGPEGRRDDAFYYSRRAPDPVRTYSLWVAYVAGALANTAGRPRMFVSYEEHFDDRRGLHERLARFVGRDAPPEGSAADRRLSELVDPGLRHFSTPPESVVGDERLPSETASLYLMTELLREARAGEGSAAGAGGLERLERGLDLYAERLLAERSAAASSPGSMRARSGT